MVNDPPPEPPAGGPLFDPFVGSLGQLFPSERWAWRVSLAGPRSPVDGTLSISARGSPDVSSWQFAIEFKQLCLPRTAMQLVHEWWPAVQLPRPLPLLLVAPRLGPRTRAVLAEAGHSWLEPGGDCELQSPGLLVRVQGTSRAELLPSSRRRVADLFHGKALRIVRWLLAGSVDSWKVHDMASAAQVSAPFVTRLFETLAAEAFVERGRGWTRVTDREALLKAWAVAPPPKVVAHHFVHPDGVTGALAALLDWRSPYAVTAEAAADQTAAAYTRFTRVEAYVETVEDVPAHLLPVPKGGNLVLFQSEDEGVFDATWTKDGLRLVSEPQLYVDLFRRGGAAREAAGVLLRSLLHGS